MKILNLLVFLFSASAFADNFKFRLYEDSIKQFTPYVLSIDFSGKFETGSVPLNVTLTLEKSNQSVVLFKWDSKTIDKVFKFKWVGKNTLSINQVSDGLIFKSLVKKEIPNGWGDTSINPNDEYTVWIDDPGILLTPEGTLNNVLFNISNQTVEETCLWGLLKK